MSRPDGLPVQDFREIGILLRMFTLRELNGLQAAEEFAFHAASPGVDASLKEARMTAELLGKLTVFFERLAPRESEVCQALSDIITRRSAS